MSYLAGNSTVSCGKKKLYYKVTRYSSEVQWRFDRVLRGKRFSLKI